MGEKAERQRLRVWLENQVNSGRIPDLLWVNKSQGIFKVPWKHAGKPGFVMERDAAVFREWARHTGKYKDGDQPDPSTWKTRFRCALNKLPDIEEVKEESRLDGEEPFKVFQFLSRGLAKNTGMSPFSDALSHIGSPTCPVVKSENCAIDGLMDIDDGMADNGVDLFQDLMLESFHDETDFAEDVGSCLMPEGPIGQTVDPVAFVSMIDVLGMSPEAMEVDVNIYYKGKKVAQKDVTNKFGCRIHSGVETTWLLEYPDLHGPREAEQIRFPDEGSPRDMMENLSRGLLLQWENNSIWATRLCKAHVYASGGCLASTIQRLERKERTKVFDCDNFLAGLADYRLSRAPVPSYEIFFVFGQQPASGTTIDPGVNITVSLTHLTAKASISMIGSANDVTISIEDNEDVLVKSFQQLLKAQQVSPLVLQQEQPSCT